MTEYLRKVQYYETDKMGIVHHSNYIRWFEEARIAFLDECGMPFEKLEEQGLVSPVLSVDCKYKTPVSFGQTVKISAEIKEFGAARFKFSYIVCDEKSGAICAIGETSHCFLDSTGRIVSLKKKNPELCSFFEKLITK